MPKLTEAQKEEIVVLFATFKRPADVVVHMREEWGIEVSRYQVRSYDPSNPRYEAEDKWRDLFTARRQRYLEEVASVPIANQGFRMNLLNEMALRAFHKGEIALAAQVLEQAAKEMGRVLTNKSELRISDNRKPTVRDMTPEDRKLALAELIRQAMEKMKQPETRQ
ncbi:MAG: DUF2280 domain-containing protein [Novosphingobium sp.]|uniref:DUF2280 domain-containing protein n=1 Tax=Novosphingobium sp. TaxID=1874826 RepID=UPI003B9B4629